MKLASRRWLAVALAGLACLLAPWDGWSHVPRSREARGVIQAVEPIRQVMTFKADKIEKPLVIEWTRHTRFFRDGELVKADALKPAVRACVYYRSPVFSPRFATKVVWSTSTQQP